MGSNLDCIICPLCGMNRIRYAKQKGYAMWPGYQVRASANISPTIFSVDNLVIQAREAGGKIAGTGTKGRGMAPALGFKIDPSKSLTLRQMVGNPDYAEDLVTLATAVQNVYEQFKALGLVK